MGQRWLQTDYTTPLLLYRNGTNCIFVERPSMTKNHNYSGSKVTKVCPRIITRIGHLCWEWVTRVLIIFRSELNGMTRSMRGSQSERSWAYDAPRLSESIRRAHSVRLPTFKMSPTHDSGIQGHTSSVCLACFVGGNAGFVVQLCCSGYQQT